MSLLEVMLLDSGPTVMRGDLCVAFVSIVGAHLYLALRYSRTHKNSHTCGNNKLNMCRRFSRNKDITRLLTIRL